MGENLQMDSHHDQFSEPQSENQFPGYLEVSLICYPYSCSVFLTGCGIALHPCNVGVLFLFTDLLYD